MPKGSAKKPISKIINFPRLIASIIICEGAGIIGSIFTISIITTWYQTLNKPPFNPPNWVFGPVWTILYALMGISLYVIWQKGVGKKEVRNALIIFGAQLFFNAVWSILFFGLKNPLYGLVDIVIMWFLIVITIYKFWKIDVRAGSLLLPYFAWVSFATMLNFNIWLLNL